jgi:predicted TIM-barrel fold metal-dependent hydrolase
MEGKKRGLTKRDFLKIGALGVTGIAGLSNPRSAPAAAQEKQNAGASEANNKIDVHGHFHPPEFFKEMENRIGRSQQMLGWKQLDMEKDTFMQTFPIEKRLDWMSKFGIEVSVFSFPTINVFMDEMAAPKKRNEMSQFMNDFFAKTHQKYPKRTLFFADVPLGTDPDFSTKELNRAVTQLGLHGAAIQTNNAGKLPHEPEFNEFFSEAERLDVPIFMHPSDSPWFKYAYSGLKKYMLESTVGFPADATIAIAYMIMDGFFERHKKSKIILTHLGSAAPYLYERLTQRIKNPYVPPQVSGKANMTKMPLEYLQMFYYDTAGGTPEALVLCESILDQNKILFGTDHPFLDNAERGTIEYINRAKITDQQREKVYSKNAATLFKLKA